MDDNKTNSELHRSQHIGWLRATVLGANDGIISTASLVIGVAAANSTRQSIVLTGIAGLVAGAMSMASGEYVSVSSQSDTEKADLDRESEELSLYGDFEREELAQIYVGRGLEKKLALQVAKQLMGHDALGSHARDELGITSQMSARPIQAAFASAASFAIGAIIPLLVVLLSSQKLLIPLVAISSLTLLILLGTCAAKVGGANVWKGALRVAFWGAIAMGGTFGAGALFGAAV